MMFLAINKILWSYSGHKIAVAIVLDFGKGGFGCDGGVCLWHYYANDGVVTEWRRRDI